MTKTQHSKTRSKPKANPDSAVRLVFFNQTKRGQELMARSNALLQDDIPKFVSNKKIRIEHLKKISPKTENQQRMFEQYEEGYSLLAHGSAGTGKTFISLYLSLREILLRESPYEKVVVVRSITPVHDIGFLPGTAEEKIDVYQQPYKAIFQELFPLVDSPTEKLIEQNLYEFVPTSFIRGITLHKSIIIMDEFSSATLHENDSVISRLGDDCKIIFCGDLTQTDLQKRDDINGINKFMNILKHVPEFRSIEFTSDDIVRGPLVKSYIMAKERLEQYENK